MFSFIIPWKARQFIRATKFATKKPSLEYFYAMKKCFSADPKQTLFVEW